MFPAPRTNPDFIPSVRRHVKWSRLIRFYPNTSFDEALVTSHFHVDFLDLATVNSECIPEVKVVKVRLWLVTSFSCQGVHASKQASKPTSSTALFRYASGIFNWAVKTLVDWLIYGIKLPGCTGIITNHCKDPCQTVEWNVTRFYTSQLSSFAKETCLLETEAQRVEPKAWQTWQSCWFSCSEFISFSAARCLAGALRSREDPLNGGQVSTPRSIIYQEVLLILIHCCGRMVPGLLLRSSEVPNFFSEALKTFSRTFFSEAPKLRSPGLFLWSSEAPNFQASRLQGFKAQIGASELQDFKAFRHG